MRWSSSTRAPTRAALPGIQCLVLRMWMVPIPRSDSNTSRATGFSICLQSRTGKELTAVQQNEHMQPPTLIQTSNTSSRICHPCSMYNKRVYTPWNAPAETQFMTPNRISSYKASSPDTPPATRQDPPASFQDSAPSLLSSAPRSHHTWASSSGTTGYRCAAEMPKIGVSL